MIETMDAGQVIGTIQSMDEENIVLETESTGTITLQQTKVKKIKRLTKANFVKGKYWFDHPNRTRYFLGSSGFGLKKGEGFYQNILLFYNGAAYGFSDNFSVAAGGNLLDWARFLLLSPQFSFPVSEKIHLGTGVTFALLPNGDASAFLYGVATFGTPKANFSVNLGYGYNEGGLAEVPFASVSGQLRFAKNFAFVTENFLIPYDSEVYVMGSYGLRILFESVSIDIGLLVNDDTVAEFTIGFPFGTLVVPFGK